MNPVALVTWTEAIQTRWGRFVCTESFACDHKLSQRVTTTESRTGRGFQRLERPRKRVRWGIICHFLEHRLRYYSNKSISSTRPGFGPQDSTFRVKKRQKDETTKPDWGWRTCFEDSRCAGLTVGGFLGENLNGGCWSFSRHLMRREQDVCRASRRIISLQVGGRFPCLMPCNTPLYRSMWRLSSLISACDTMLPHFLFLTLCFSFFDLHLLLAESFFSHLFFTKSALAIHYGFKFFQGIYVLNVNALGEHFFSEDHGMSKHWSAVASLAMVELTYTQCMIVSI